ncbi:vacuolar protein sorting/targeting protein PEP1, partial [Elasticomyces elasticus]
MAAVKKFIVVAARSEGTDELALYVTKDSSTWHKAEFGQHRIAEDAYTILESTNYSMQVDVLGSRRINPMGFLFTSNSNGTYFTRNIDHTNRNIWGTVDFEKVSNIQGVYLVNTVTNFEAVDGPKGVEKEVVSQITFDDGRTFQDLNVGKEMLQLHSVSDAQISGRIFSSPAPGIVMGVGNTGKYLKNYDRGDLYVSDDTGVTWTKAEDGPHMYEFGNQGAVLVAIENGRDKSTDKIKYSLDHGKTWLKADLDKKIVPYFLTTVPDSTTLSFLVGGWHGGDDGEFHVSKVDFNGLHERSCGKKDFEEKWPARVDDKGKPSCIMGHKQFYRRRKADAECVIEGEFVDPVPIFEPCECTVADFECDFNFERSEDRQRCMPVEALPMPDGVCKSEKDTFRSSSGWRRIPGNECSGGEDLAKEIDRPCSDNVAPPSGTDIMVEKTNFNARKFREWFYLERGVRGKAETIVMLDDVGDIFLTQDHGKSWAPILEGKTITSIFPNPHYHDRLYFLTGGERVYYTIDNGEHFDFFDAPKPPSDNKLPTLRFHPDFKDWMLWSGLDTKGGRTNIYYTTDRGDNWSTLIRGARKCDYIHREYKDEDKLIICEQYDKEDPETKTLKLLSSDNFFADSTEHYSDILDFATMAEFIIVAQKTEDKQSLKVDASVNGETYAAAEFPKNFQISNQQAYT